MGVIQAKRSGSVLVEFNSESDSDAGLRSSGAHSAGASE
jgi:hypothetical protein